MARNTEEDIVYIANVRIIKGRCMGLGAAPNPVQTSLLLDNRSISEDLISRVRL